MDTKALAAMAETIVALERRVEALEQVNRDRTAPQMIEVIGYPEDREPWDLRKVPDATPEISDCPDCCALVEGPMADHRPFCPNQKVS